MKGWTSSPGFFSQIWDNKDKLKLYIEPVKIFQEKYNIPDYQILAGEFGGHRCSKGLEHYFRDLIPIPITWQTYGQ